MVFLVRRRFLQGRRDRLTVYLDILNAILECCRHSPNGKAKFTHVMYMSNLSSKRLKERLIELLYLDLVSWDSDGIKLTQKGLSFLNDCEKAMKIIMRYFNR